jgi:hypothetical protein
VPTISWAGRGWENMLSIRRLTPSIWTSQMIWPMKGRTSIRPRELVSLNEATPEG